MALTDVEHLKDGNGQAANPACRIKQALEAVKCYRPCRAGQLRRAPTAERLEKTKSELPLPDLARYQDEVINEAASALKKKETVLYLAYGSNLSYSTFQGVRGIKPLSQINVLVPELRLTFDIPGIPYNEPCFANTARRDPTNKPNPAPPSAGASDYHKDRWRKGLIGVVYEVTPEDFAHIIATEGGGSGYQDVLAVCYPLEPGAHNVPDEPRTDPFKAHTLFAPYSPPDKPTEGGRVGRPDPAYAQASARYLQLISGGAREHDMPREYLDYLDGLRPYTVTTLRQRAGMAVMMVTWGPLVLAIFRLSVIFQDKKTGRNPPWVTWLSGIIFTAVWRSYDSMFKPVFGDGERTIGQEDDVAAARQLGSGGSANEVSRRGLLSGLRTPHTMDDSLAEKLLAM